MPGPERPRDRSAALAVEPARPSTPAHRLLRRAALAYFVAVFLATLWPVYPLFAGIDPVILHLPLSLAFQVILIGLSFGVLLGLYWWERRHGSIT